MKNRILIAEDEIELARAVKAILIYNKYDVDVVFDGKSAVDSTKQNNYDVIIMDIMMPVMDGIEALKQIRKDGINTPIILLTAKSQVEEKVQGLDSGANDYLTKPFDKNELLARIRALIRANNERKQKFHIGNIIFNKEDSELSNNNISYKLNNKECDIMEYLVKNQERTVSEEELCKKIWNQKENDKSVPMYMLYLQNKFIALNANFSIKNDNGYKLESNI